MIQKKQVNKNLYFKLLDQLQRYFDSRDKSREYIDNKISLFIAQAVISIGFIAASNICCKLLAILPVFIALILYVIGIYPYKIYDNPSKAVLEKATIDIKNNAINDTDGLFKLLIGFDYVDDMKKAFAHNDKMLNLKRKLLISGLILNIIGIFYLIVQLF